MLTLLDGPAKGKTLDCKRGPMFLRVVIADDGTVDALDQLEDTPEDNETVYVYFTENTTRAHLLVRGKNRHRGGFRDIADYKLYETQPDDEVLRDNSRWQEWAYAEADRKRTGA